MPRKIEISHRTIIFTFVFVGFAWLIFQIREIIFLLFLSVIFMSAMNPAVDKLESKGFPRWLSITLLYLLVVSVISLIIASIIPALVEQTTNFISQLPTLAQLLRIADIDPGAITSQLTAISRIPGNLLRITAGIFSNLIFIFTLAMVTFYLLLERKNLKKYLRILFDNDGEKRAEEMIDKIEFQLGSWVRGQLILMTAIGLLSYSGLILLGIPYALPLAIIAGILEVVPSIGPVISAVPAVLAGFMISPYTALIVAILYFFVQQVENSFLVPQVMRRATGVNPLLSIISLMIGFELAGPAGAILAIPTLLIIRIVVTEIYSSNRFHKL
jgi:predicted PurR-regulated permease PerM